MQSNISLVPKIKQQKKPEQNIKLNRMKLKQKLGLSAFYIIWPTYKVVLLYSANTGQLFICVQIHITYLTYNQ